MEIKVKFTASVFLIFTLLVISANSYVYPHDRVSALAGEIRGTVYLEYRVNILNTVTVTKDAVLKIKPGSALVCLNPQARLIVYGSIQALGDKGEPIYFESPLPGSSWLGIRLKGSSGPNIFKYCRFRRAATALEVDNSRAFIRQCRFRQNKAPLKIRGEQTRLKVIENSFRDNLSNRLIAGKIVPSQVLFEHNYWRDKKFDGKNNQTYNGIRFSPLADDPTDWTTE